MARCIPQRTVAVGRRMIIGLRARRVLAFDELLPHRGGRSTARVRVWVDQWPRRARISRILGSVTCPADSTSILRSRRDRITDANAERFERSDSPGGSATLDWQGVTSLTSSSFESTRSRGSVSDRQHTGTRLALKSRTGTYRFPVRFVPCHVDCRPTLPSPTAVDPRQGDSFMKVIPGKKSLPSCASFLSHS